MTGKIKTLRADQGFGFIRDDGARNISFIKALFTAKASTCCEWATAWNIRLARTDQRVRGLKTSGARPRSGTLPIRHANSRSSKLVASHVDGRVVRRPNHVRHDCGQRHVNAVRCNLTTVRVERRQCILTSSSRFPESCGRSGLEPSPESRRTTSGKPHVEVGVD